MRTTSSIARVGLVDDVLAQQPPISTFHTGIPDVGRRGMETDFKQQVLDAASVRERHQCK